MKIFRYKRTETGLVKTLVTLADLKAPAVGEFIALPGKKPRTYRAPVRLDANKRPVRPALTKIRGRKGA